MHPFKAIGWFFRILFRGDAALAQAAPPTFAQSTEPAVQLLALLQKEGRLVDFLREDISQYSDAEIGAAVRPIHDGCRRVLEDRFQLRRVIDGEEGSTVEVPAENFDPSAIELHGNVASAGPWRGRLIHGGWYAGEVKLPTVPEGADPRVAAPAQVEVNG